MLFARNVKFQIKEGKLDDFNRTFSADVLPVLKAQAGFKNELTLLNKSEALGISLWQDRGSAEKYETTAYTKVLDKLMPFLNGTPIIEKYDVGVSTLH